jgi:hypothetical protein
VSLVALVVSISVMVVYLTGQSVTSGAAVVVPFTSMVNCNAALPYVLKQASVSAAFCVDTSRVPAR